MEQCGRRERQAHQQVKHGNFTRAYSSANSRYFPLSSPKSTSYKAMAAREPPSRRSLLQLYLIRISINLLPSVSLISRPVSVYTKTGMNGLTSHKEKFTVIDAEKRVTVPVIVEGGFLDMGFTLYRVRFEMLAKEGMENQCTRKQR
ncbi:hypothetical protein CDL12_29101 [Handroanthus impetiginosus]|uniref:Uncharacterized protein n=1 Tax=Handroanthus impetiginosus TaxID=429701 RepID=A0A2G9FZV4_9LAMI|nr:hypothetical protein CDL12_29101 [Handroanthus impetiginosus]